MSGRKQSKRVFVGIKMSDEIADECAKLQASLVDLPARFIPREDMHLTLLPPWEMTDQSFVEDRLREVLERAKRFTLKLERLSYGPNEREPRLAWIECAVTPEIVSLEKDLSRTFNVRDRFSFIPHVTLVRFRKEDKKKLLARPIEQAIALSMPVESVELFETPHLGGVGYTVLSSLLIPVDDSDKILNFYV